MATKNQLAIARLKKSTRNARGQLAKANATVKQYSPSVAKTLTVAGGGFIAGCVQSGQYIPSSVAGVSTPLVIGGLLASYGIFASKEGDMISSLAVNLGNGMISAWASTMALDMHGAVSSDISQSA